MNQERLIGDILIVLGAFATLFLLGSWHLVLIGLAITGGLIYLIRVIVTLREPRK